MNIKASLNHFPHARALRPRQWSKNLIVFAAPLFAFSFDRQSLSGSLLAFVLFCCTSSSFYLFNDIIDREADRCHPIKRERPIAAGLIGVPEAMGIAIVLLGISLAIGWRNSPDLGLTILGYAVLQFAYNFRLKRIVILDIVAIAIGFVLRAYAGAVAAGIVLSSWFLLCTAMLALFLGIEKRKAELRLVKIVESQGGMAKKRAVLQRYSLPLLHRMESVVTTGAIMSYALWSAGPRLGGASTPWMLLTLPLVIYGIFRYQLLGDPEEIARRNPTKVERGGPSERPEEILLTDRPILMTFLSWVVMTFVILLFSKYKVV